MLRDVIGNLLHEPLEALAAMFLSELFQAADVPVGQRESLRPTGVEIVLILIPPHLHHPHIVLHAANKEKGGYRLDYSVSVKYSFDPVLFSDSERIIIE